MFPSLTQVCKNNLSWEDAKTLAEKWSNGCDVYTSYEIEEMKPSIKDIRQEKLINLDKKIKK